MDMVPLRELMDQHHQGVVERLDRIENRLDHTHPEKVSWASFVGTLVPLMVGLVGLIFVMAG